ncbi:MAG: SPOR domain-containing protein [Acidimicrobiia bacterium]
MSGTRFGVLLALAAAAVAAAAFFVGLQVLDDDTPGRPPAGGSTAGPGAADEGPADDDAAEATSPVAPTVADEELPSPSWVLVISSEGEEAGARAVAEEVTAAGHPGGLLRSDAYPSLNPGFWVAYAGPYPDAAAAAAEQPVLEADGWSGAYVRCVGAVADCGEPDPDGDGGEDDDG